MRVVESAEDMKKMFRMARDEAQKAFNDPSVFIEKYVKNPRHIEFQIIADNQGNIVHLGERECSIQRKHQKLIEEAPSTALDQELREQMGNAAIRMAQAVKYVNAGTVEFLLDSERNFYFMEMNTRIQVEHPVTEYVTDIDLIEQQINVADNKKLPFTQDDIKINGWAIECRINAEDVQSNFSPNLGIIDKVVLPKGDNIRVDTGIKEGAEITAFYDSMIAKLICYGEDRNKAISNSLSALRRFKIKGLKTTIPFCKAALSNKAFKRGDLNTSFIEKEMDPIYYQEPFEELLAAFFVTQHFADEVKSEKETYVDYNKGKNLNPWVLNKRLKSI
jgi:acetyl-CoA carboxylase biotin carboxylase subunit